jgi:hypothetical protein
MSIQIKKIIGYTSVLTLLFSLICIFPVILNFIYIIRDRDVLINYKKYIKKTVLIDSLNYINMDGSDTDRINGYSKELNNYKTVILFGDIKRNQSVSHEGMHENGSFKQCVWYRKGEDFAYPANKKDKKFPIKNFISDKIKLPLAWIFALFVTILLNKKYKQLNQSVNENKN